MRAVEPEPPKQEEVDPLAAAAETGPPNAKNSAASNANAVKKDPTPPPYRYCMPTHAVYTEPKPTARKTFDSFFLSLALFWTFGLLIFIFFFLLIIFMMSLHWFNFIRFDFYLLRLNIRATSDIERSHRSFSFSVHEKALKERNFR